MPKAKHAKILDVIQNTPGGKLIINPTGDRGIEVMLQTFGECSKRLIVTGAKVTHVEPVEEVVAYHLPENEAGQATLIEGRATREEHETIKCVLVHLDNGRTIQISQFPLSIEDYRVIDGRLEWPADDRPRI